MRLLAITFALSLFGGCVDELGNDSDPEQEELDDIDPSNDTDTGNNIPDQKCGDGSLPDDDVTNVSRKKADGSCF